MEHGIYLQIKMLGAITLLLRARTLGCHFYCGCGGGVLVHLYLYTFCLYLIQGGDENLLNNQTLFLITLGNKIVFFL